MPELYKLYEAIKNDTNYSVGSQEEFVKKFSDSTSLQKLHGVLAQDDKYVVGGWDAFYDKFGSKKKEPSIQDSPTGSAPDAEGDIFAPYDPMQQDTEVAPRASTATEAVEADSVSSSEFDKAPESTFRTAIEKGEQVQEGGKIPIDEMDIGVIDDPMEKSTFEYIAQQGAAGSLAFQGVLFMTHLDNALALNVEKPFQYAKDRFAHDMGKSAEQFEDYDPTIMEQIGSGLFGLSLDMGVGMFAAQGSVAKGTLKAGNYVKTKLLTSGVPKVAANRTAKQVVINNIVQGGAVTGLTLAQYGAGSDFMNQMADPNTDITDIDYSHVLKASAKEGLIGTFAGFAGAGTHMISHAPWIDKVAKAAAGREVIRAGVGTAGVLGEAGVFTLGGALMHGEPVTMDDFIVNAGTFAGLKTQGIPGKLKSLETVRQSENFTEARRNKGEFKTEFSRSEILDLNRGRELGNTTEAIIERLGKQGETLSQVLNDPQVPWTTKAKIMHASHGVLIDKPPDAINVKVRREPDGRYVGEMFDAKGNVIERAYYNSAEKAHKEAAHTDIVIKEADALRRTHLMLPENYNKLNNELLAKGVEGGLTSEALTQAVMKHPSKRTAEEAKAAKIFTDASTEIIPVYEGISRAGETLRAEAKAAEKVPEKPVEPSKGKSEGKVPLEGESVKTQGKSKEKPTEDVPKTPKKPSITLERDTKTENIRGEGHFVYRVKDKGGEQLGLLTMNKREDIGGYAIENALIDKPRQGTGTKAYKQVAKELDAPIISDVQKNQTKASKGFWEKMVTEGAAEKFTDKYGNERYRTIKPKQDAIQEPSTKKMDVETQPKVSTEVREGDAKKPEPAAKEADITTKEGKTKYYAESVQSEASISSKEFNAKAESLKAKFEKHKADESTRKWAVDSFVKAHRAKINEAGLSAAEVRALSNAKTWNQVSKAMQKVEKALEKPTTKMRAAEITDFIRENRGQFEGLNKPAYEALLKKVAEASQSDAKLHNAQQYMEMLMIKKAEKDALALEKQQADMAKTERQKIVERENKKAEAREAILKLTSEKALFQGKAKHGKRRRIVKKPLRREDRTESEILKDIQEIGEFIEKGHSKRTPEPLKEMERVGNDLSALRMKETFSNADMVQEVALMERLMQLRFAQPDLSLEQTQVLLKYAKDLISGERSRATTERIERSKQLAEWQTLVIDVGSGSRGIIEGSKAPSKKRKVVFTDMYGDSSIRSYFSKLARQANFERRNGVFNDPLNEVFYEGKIMKAENTNDGLKVRHAKEFDSALKDAFGKQIQFKIVDGSIVRRETGAYSYTQDGRRAEHLAFSQFTAAEKLMQARDPNGYESMMKPIEDGGMGYTPKTLKQLEAFVKPEYKKLAEWMYDNQKKWFKEVYDPAYIEMNGISMANSEMGYWPLPRATTKAVTGDMESVYRPRTVLNDRGIMRTGQTTPLEYTSILDTYTQYINEAARYASWAKPHKELSYIFKNPDVRTVITQYHGTDAVRAMDYFLDKFAGQNKRYSVEWMDWMTDRASRGILALKPMVGVKQTISSVYYGLDMPYHNLTVGMSDMLLNRSKTNMAVENLLTSHPWYQARRNTGVERGMDVEYTAKNPHYGLSITRGGELKRQWNIARAKTAARTYGTEKAVQDAQGKLIEWGDKTPIIKAGGAYFKYKYKQYSGKEITSKDIVDFMDGKPNKHLERAYTDWFLLSEATQQSMRESNVSRMRGDSSYGRAINLFTSGPAQIWRVEQDAYRTIARGVRMNDGKAIRDGSRRLMISHVLSGALFGLANSRFTWDPEEMMWDIALGNVKGVANAGKVFQLVQDLYLDKPWAGDGFGDVPSIGIISDLLITSTELTKEMSAPIKDAREIRKLKNQMFIDMSTFFGYGVQGAVSWGGGIQRVVEGESKAPFRDALGLSNEYTADQVRITKDRSREIMETAIGFNKQGKPILDDKRFERGVKLMLYENIDPTSIADGIVNGAIRKEMAAKYGTPETAKDVLELMEKAKTSGEKIFIMEYYDRLLDKTDKDRQMTEAEVELYTKELMLRLKAKIQDVELIHMGE